MTTSNLETNEAFCNEITTDMFKVFITVENKYIFFKFLLLEKLDTESIELIFNDYNQFIIDNTYYEQFHCTFDTFIKIIINENHTVGKFVLTESAYKFIKQNLEIYAEKCLQTAKIIKSKIEQNKTKDKSLYFVTVIHQDHVPTSKVIDKSFNEFTFPAATETTVLRKIGDAVMLFNITNEKMRKNIDEGLKTLIQDDPTLDKNGTIMSVLNQTTSSPEKSMKEENPIAKPIQFEEGNLNMETENRKQPKLKIEFRILDKIVLASISNTSKAVIDSLRKFKASNGFVFTPGKIQFSFTYNPSGLVLPNYSTSDHQNSDIIYFKSIEERDEYLNKLIVGLNEYENHNYGLTERKETSVVPIKFDQPNYSWIGY